MVGWCSETEAMMGMYLVAYVGSSSVSERPVHCIRKEEDTREDVDTGLSPDVADGMGLVGLMGWRWLDLDGVRGTWTLPSSCMEMMKTATRPMTSRAAV